MQKRWISWVLVVLFVIALVASYRNFEWELEMTEAVTPESMVSTQLFQTTKATVAQKLVKVSTTTITATGATKDTVMAAATTATFWATTTATVTAPSITLDPAAPPAPYLQQTEKTLEDLHPGWIKCEEIDSVLLQLSKLENSINGLRHLPLQRHTIMHNSVEHDKNNSYFYKEEFTIVMLTHQKRKEDLPKTIENLVRLPGLKSLILIWNGPNATTGIQLPKTPFPIRLFSNGRNSLNNRFLPLSIIETEAILSMDDDMFPTHESIIFAFSVWQEFRDRIVGFPGRGVKWTGSSWVYDTSSCTISLVLTGLAFLHKKYLNLYTYEMPSAIRDKVDNFTNCEDIAMNFLVSHVTKTSPIKVTNQNAWACVGCDPAGGDEALWKTPRHFEERNDCINFFSEVYGYTPLYKADFRMEDYYGGRCTREIEGAV